MDKKIKVGSTVVLFPGDTHRKVCKIIDIDNLGFTFEIIEGTELGHGYAIGDILFYNHSRPLSLSLISNKITICRKN